MKHFALAILFVAFATGLAWSALAQEATPTPTLTSTSNSTYTSIEYKMVPMSDIHASTLDYLKGALGESQGGILGLAKAADDQLAKKTEDLLNELGAEGWELLHYSKTSMILMRRAR